MLLHPLAAPSAHVGPGISHASAAECNPGEDSEASVRGTGNHPKVCLGRHVPEVLQKNPYPWGSMSIDNR